LNALCATTAYANNVQKHVPIVKKRTVKIVLTMSTSVRVARKQERNKKMKKLKNSRQPLQKPALRFSPTAWAKLVFLRDITDNEVGGFGITEKDDLLFVTDFALVKQKVTPVSVSFDDNAVADFFDEQVEAGKRPEQFARIWLHTHPGNSPEPSGTDESTFQRVFSSCDWSVMVIVAQQGNTYARLRFSAGPGGESKIPICVDYDCEFHASNFDRWQQQYLENVTEDQMLGFGSRRQNYQAGQAEMEVFGSDGFDSISSANPEDLIEELELMHPLERQTFMEELAVRSDFWDEYESEVLYE